MEVKELQNSFLVKKYYYKVVIFLVLYITHSFFTFDIYFIYNLMLLIF